MKITEELMERFLEGRTSPEETVQILAEIAVNPKLEEYVVTRRRVDYSTEQMEDYSSFIPVNSNASDDGRNLCDFQCETFILKKAGHEVKEDELAAHSRHNYWLRSQGTPLFNMGKLLEENGFLVNRKYDSSIDELEEDLKGHEVIVVVNGDILIGKDCDIFSENFNLEDNPNHAVIVLSIDREKEVITLYNPAKENVETEYPLILFLDAWGESKNFAVTVREKKFPEEYNPQPIDVSSVSLNAELVELTELIAENAHDVWALARKKEGVTYATERDDKKKTNPCMVPYSMLPNSEKQVDRDMAFNTIKLLKRLGYRLVNINSMYRCPDCGEIIEPGNNFCPNCGKQLSWEDFR